MGLKWFLVLRRWFFCAPVVIQPHHYGNWSFFLFQDRFLLGTTRLWWSRCTTKSYNQLLGCWLSRSIPPQPEKMPDSHNMKFLVCHTELLFIALWNVWFWFLTSRKNGRGTRKNSKHNNSKKPVTFFTDHHRIFRYIKTSGIMEMQKDPGHLPVTNYFSFFLVFEFSYFWQNSSQMYGLKKKHYRQRKLFYEKR